MTQNYNLTNKEPLMSFFTTKINPEALSDSQAGNYITTSGIYPVTIKFVSVKVNEHNARSLDFNVDYNGTQHTFYGLKLDNNDGTPNYQADVFNKLCVIAGLDTVADPEIQTHNLGKDNTPTDLAVLTDFSDLEVNVRISFEYKVYEGEIRENKVIKSFYSADGRTASEIVNNTPPKQMDKDAEYAKNVYKDDLTEADVEAWKAAKKEGKAAPVTKAPAVNKFAGAGATKPSFMKK